MESIFDHDRHPIIISGPCSAESEEQLYDTAKELIGSCSISAFRAGIWKPRTRPNSFEGRGAIALPWMQRIKEEFKVPITVEVANAQHVEHALKHDVDILWIGARTTVNPFSVQEIADALKGTKVPVMIKNPMFPDLSLWIGAIERIYQAGTYKIAAIHRGFTAHKDAPFRNIPKWEIPIELQRLFPDLDIICDPSHIAGNRQLIKSVSQFALDLSFRGLMIESHIHPETALSDAKQQVVPSDLKTILASLKHKRSPLRNGELLMIEQLRSSIDDIDMQLIDIIYERLQLIKEVGRIKSKSDLPVLQLKRWKKILETRTAIGAEKGLSTEFVKDLLELIHKESVRVQIEDESIYT
ncbi:MAG: bifunctional 3-deoxy-7-phosphoheptulonate synthase/chorismate mutase type II [Crocinitomicaceae bacterium]|nr:bifunctional 3-deoxy-7-phosphoheptulonate synthase/chorismate mutase type II [Crocinitomicaceae bacterium]